MEAKAAGISRRIQVATARRIQQYQQLQGKKVGDFPFWDVVVIGAGDKSQKVAFELQLQDKLVKEQLPLGVDYCVVADPGVDKIGDGGSVMAILQCLKETYREELQSKKILVMPAGGYSQRLPNASLLGKLFISVPVGDPFFQMLDIKLALTIDYPAKMTAGIFLAVADCIELYDDEDSPDWSFNLPGVTALGHPSPVSIGTGHGVFVLPDKQDFIQSVEVVSTLEFLHKQSVEAMRQKEAILPKVFCSSIGTEEEIVLTDSSYFMDFNTALKLREFYYNESPLHCEIDGFGDFLQPLGPRASTDFIKNTSNKSCVTQNLTSVRQKLYDVLQGTPLHVAVMKYSHFYHIGTTNEYLDHICSKTTLAKEIGFLQSTPSNPEYNPAESPKSADGLGEKAVLACVINSICPKGTRIHDRCVVEWCEFSSSVIVQSNSIVSNCHVQAAFDRDLINIPESTFLYTACISNSSFKRQFVTVGFGVHDNLKKVVQAKSLGKLSIFGKSFDAICGKSQNQVEEIYQVEDLIFPGETVRDLWHAKLFQPASTMEEAFASTMVLMETLMNVTQWEPAASDWEGRLSMADLIQMKDIFGMLDYKRKLMEKISLK